MVLLNIKAVRDHDQMVTHSCIWTESRLPENLFLSAYVHTNKLGGHMYHKVTALHVSQKIIKTITKT